WPRAITCSLDQRFGRPVRKRQNKLLQAPRSLAWKPPSWRYMLAWRRETGIRSEIHPHADRNDALPAGRCDAAEIGGIDVRVWITELRGVQQIDGVTSHDQFLVLTQTNLLHQVHVEPECTRTLQISWRESTDSTRRRIDGDHSARCVGDILQRTSVLQTPRSR